ncbi:SDR family oxidoreductase [Actinomyces glycerinitolerans]|uniref:Short-chain dehydrogenase/reductase sdr n=1 Tax=Actinomyces glycerinitolerans TaxID=1892869 RepID=A0A1M4RY11_9ACTO|nr:SDR family oxidoreductase [Actinomyces glycerinitolerans]SHE24874.1 short-chain dehydrogenase/reductase sdr [Actinomyces glycerinitolerans]
MSTKRPVTVLLGAGAIGTAIARRVTNGGHIVVADLRLENAQKVREQLLDAGYSAEATTTDLADPASIRALAEHAASLGPVSRVILAGGVSPSQADIPTILRVDLYGFAVALEEFGKVIAPAGSGVVISSQSGYRMPALTREQDALLATTPVDKLLDLPLLADGAITSTLHAYQMSKRANGLRVRANAVTWGERGARINAISPGIVITPLARDELEGPRGAGYRKQLELSPAGRAGTPDEIAALAGFLMGPEAGYINGTDVLADGGVTASWYYGPLSAGGAN